MNRFTRLFRVVVLVAVMALGIGPSAYAQEGAPGTPTPIATIGTSAQVGTGGGTGEGQAAVIECKWELPDMDGNAANGMQYVKIATNPTRQYDDDMTKAPDGDLTLSGVQVPCAGPPAAKPTMKNNVGIGQPTTLNSNPGMIQVRPNAHDDPTERLVELWGAADHPASLSQITGAFWDIFHPDGSLKIQVHATRFTDCNAMGRSDLNGSMLQAAVGTGQLTAGASDDPSKSIVALCNQNVKAIFNGNFTISKHQPYGKYKIVFNVVANGTPTTLTNYIDVLPFYNLELDFNAVNWGQIFPGQVKYNAGDVIFDSPIGANPPTVRNTGNSGATIAVLFHKMVQTNPPAGQSPKEITEFDVCFGVAHNRLNCKDPLNAEVLWTFPAYPAPTATGPTAALVAANSNTTLCPNRNGKVDFSIHPAGFITNGIYAGSVDVFAVTSPGCLTDFGHKDLFTKATVANAHPEIPASAADDGSDRDFGVAHPWIGP